MRNVWKHVRALLAGRIRYRITRGGVLFTLTIIVVGLAAIISANNLLFLIVATMMATLLVSGLVSRLCLAGLELDFQVPEHVAARHIAPGRLFVRNQKWLMPSFSVRVEGIQDPQSPVLKTGVYLPLIPAGATLEAPVEVRFPRRGTYRQNSFAFSTSFPFGFLEKSARVTLGRETIVYPSIQPRPGFEDLFLGVAGEIETHYRGLGKDFYRIRPYENFESARHVDWKASAHIGSLQVREFAREQEQTVEVFLDRDVAPVFDAWFEHAIDCCAFLCWRLAARGTAIHFRAPGFLFRLPLDGDIYTILKYLALVYPQRGGVLEKPLDEISYKIVFTPSPNRFLDAGWTGARMLGPGVLAIPAPDAAAESV
ncbi:MAG TPA: DUF58 domain-containing protein [Bryobacteraceae bacterium]|nr:DUF58 domain-containing protein [Bryobacteraceae bacterium]